MLSFKNWIQLFEQPHAYAPTPVNFRLGGYLYREIQGIDPRIEMWPHQDIKLRFMKYAVGYRDEIGEKVDPQPIYFTDDDGATFEIVSGGATKLQKLIQKVGQPSHPALVMPDYWHHYAVFRTVDDDFIDNTDPSMSAKQKLSAELVQ